MDVVVNFLFLPKFSYNISYNLFGDHMKNILKTIVVPLFLASVIGLILGLNFYKTYKNNLDNDLRSSKLYLLENGEYDSIESMRENNFFNNYVYYKSNNKYKTIIGITNNYANIAKIKSIYNNQIKVTEYYIAKDNLDNKQYEYDKLLSKTSNQDEIKTYVADILKLYQNDNSLKLIALN